MTSVRLSVVALAACLTAAGNLEARQTATQTADPIPPEIVLGRQAKVEAAGEKLEGELLAVSADSLWMGADGNRFAVPLGDVSKLQVRMHGMDTQKALAWNLVAGLGSAMALTAACTSVENVSCGGVFVGWSVLWAAIGGITGAVVARSSHRSLPVFTEAIQPYVRFPQGLPPGFRTSGTTGAGDPDPGG